MKTGAQHLLVLQESHFKKSLSQTKIFLRQLNGKCSATTNLEESILITVSYADVHFYVITSG
jgi:hypothetical protein